MKRLLVFLLLTYSLASSGQTTWKSLSAIPKKWIMVERDSAGYLVYDPCNGQTPVISIDKGYLTVYWPLDAPSKFSIDKFTRLKANKALYIDASGEDGRMEFHAEIKDGKRKLVLWTFGDFRWVMIPFKDQKKFRRVENPCKTEMKRRKSSCRLSFNV